MSSHPERSDHTGRRGVLPTHGVVSATDDHAAGWRPRTIKDGVNGNGEVRKSAPSKAADLWASHHKKAGPDGTGQVTGRQTVMAAKLPSGLGRKLQNGKALHLTTLAQPP